ncbi:MAG: YncE family protein [Nitrospirae bacterium]|nr:YncE family protein [Nitrospirota bacterium]
MKKIVVLSLIVITALVVFGAISANAEEPQFKGIAYVQGHGGHIAVVDLASGEVARYVHNKPSDAITVSADGNMIYAFSLDGFSKEIDVKTGKQTEWQKFGKKHCGTAVAPDGMIWVSDMDDGKVYVYDPKTHKLADSFPVSKSICGISFSKDGKTAYISDMPGGFINILDVKTKKVTGKIEGVGNFIHRARIRPGTDELWQSEGTELKGGKPVGIGYTDAGGISGTVNIVDLKAKKIVDKVYIGGNVHDVDFTKDGKYAIVSTRQVPEMDDSALVVVDTTTKRIVKIYSACKKCHGALGVKISEKHEDAGKPFLCAVQVDWNRTSIPDSATEKTGK